MFRLPLQNQGRTAGLEFGNAAGPMAQANHRLLRGAFNRLHLS
jgi:hypothetical protein